MGMESVIDQVRAAEQQAQQRKEEARAQGAKLLAEAEQQARKEAEELIHRAKEDAASILKQPSTAWARIPLLVINTLQIHQI